MAISPGNADRPTVNTQTYSAMAKQSTSKDKYTDPKLREDVKEDVKKTNNGGVPGQWSARKGISVGWK
jgi:hypothetical protein